jgi:hypothetical protein
MERSKVDKAYDHVRGIYRNYPNWPSTFGACREESCENSARGCGLCADCHEKALAEYAGKEAAKKFHDEVRATSAVYVELVDKIRTGGSQ